MPYNSFFAASSGDRRRVLFVGLIFGHADEVDYVRYVIIAKEPEKYQK